MPMSAADSCHLGKGQIILSLPFPGSSEVCVRHYVAADGRLVSVGGDGPSSD